MSNSLHTPTFADRAQFAEESERPHLWHNLIGLWCPPLGVSGGKLFDVSGHHNHGALTDMDVSTAWVSSPHGRALDFDGSNDYVDLGTPLNFVTSQVTVAAIVRTAIGSLDRYDIVFSRCHSSGYGHRLWTRDNSSHRFYWEPIVGKYSISSTAVADSWQFVVGTYDGAVGRVYVNGVKEATDTHSAAMDATVRPAYIGAMAGGDVQRHWPGKFAFVAQWNRALLPAEIADLHADPFAMLRRREVAIPSAVNRRRRVLMGAVA